MVQVIRKEKFRIGLLLAVIVVQPVCAAPTENPEVEAKFEKGMQALADEKLESAIEAFQNILNADPSLNRVKLELALSYYRALRYEDAQQLAHHQEQCTSPQTGEGDALVSLQGRPDLRPG